MAWPVGKRSTGSRARARRKRPATGAPDAERPAACRTSPPSPTSRDLTRDYTHTAMTQSSGSSRPFAVVTGASSGIGYELAKVFAQNGYDVLAAAEPVAHAGVTLDEAAADIRALGAEVTAVPVDLATAEGVEQLARRVQSAGRPVDALALNAGVGLGGPFVEQPVDRILNLVNLNVRSVVHLARLLLPAMVARKQGKVLVTSSIAALMPGPFEAIYGASKAFELSWAHAIRNELKDSGVTVTALQPGPTDTEFFHRAGMDDTKVGSDKKDDPAEVAKEGFEAMMKGQDHVVAGSLKNALQAAATKVIPDPALAQMHRGMSEPGTASK